MTHPTDVLVSNHGSLWLVEPVSDAARDWLNENLSAERQYLGRAVAVEPRYVDDLVRGLQSGGFIVRSRATA